MDEPRRAARVQRRIPLNLDPWLAIILIVGTIIIITKFLVAFNKAADKRDARRRNQARPMKGGRS